MEQKGIGLTILGVVAIIAIVGLVLLFTGGATGKGVYNSLPGGVVSPKNVCAGVPKCNTGQQPYWADSELINGQNFHKCKCPGENGVAYVLAKE